MAAVDATIGLKSIRYAAVIVHHQVWISPMPAEVETRTTVADELSRPGRPIIHVQMNGLSVRREIQMLLHAASQIHSELLSARSTQISSAFKIAFEIHSAAARRGFKADKQYVIAALGMQFSPALPIRHDVKFSAKIKSPGIEESSHGDYEHASQHENQPDLPKASEAS